MGRQEAVYSFSKDGRGATYALEGEKALVVRMCQKRPIAVSKETYYNDIKIVIPGIAVRVTLKPPVHLLDSHKP